MEVVIPLPGLKLLRLDMQDTEADETRDNLGGTVHKDCPSKNERASAAIGLRRGRTPVTNTKRLFLAGVEHGADDHETRRDGALAHAEDKPDREEATKVLARRMRAERDAPRENVNAVR